MFPYDWTRTFSTNSKNEVWTNCVSLIYIKFVEAQCLFLLKNTLISFLVLQEKLLLSDSLWIEGKQCTNIIVKWFPHVTPRCWDTSFTNIPVNLTQTVAQMHTYLLQYSYSVLFPREGCSKDLASILLPLSRNCVIPGGCGQSNEQGLKNPSDEDNGILLGDKEVHHWQNKQPMHHQAANHRDGIETQFLPNGWRVIHF